MKFKSFGAAGEVTGSKHLIRLKNKQNILLDCGMFQGRGSESAEKNRSFGFEPSSIDYLILSHAHIDHSGLIPLLVKQGFEGKIYCTLATYDLCRIMLADSAHIQESDAAYINKKRQAEGKEGIEPLYNLDDVNRCWEFFHCCPYDEEIIISEDIHLKFTDAGHILGSAVVNLKIRESKKWKRLAFTGDIGRYINKILKRPQPFPQADFVICESTYGDRIHESIQKAKSKLEEVVQKTCIENKGKLIIPAFSIGKTQELVFMLNKLGINQSGQKIKVFVDSPLAISATEIMKDHVECFSPSTIKFMQKGADPFGFEQLFYVRDANRSKMINDLDEPCIIISASGMADAGRVKHHLANAIQDEKNAVLIIGYSEPSSLSGRLQSGDKQVSIYGLPYTVNASIYSIDFFSAHADYLELNQFLSCQDKRELKRLFLVHGNAGAQEHFQSFLYEKGFYRVDIVEAKKAYAL